ncbi:MAG: IPT/TIG domain-containing protein, partial [Deltaproteobacteria bacterium]|nr:IPT/TIG domain-containing protein [Deltaproteobacteria bacterium]
MVTNATPRFLNPKGGSTLTLMGSGFLPPWSSALGGTRVTVAGLPAVSVAVLSTTRLEAIAPPGFFGTVDIVAISPDGLQRSGVPNDVGYGLSFAGEERAVSVAPLALAADGTSPLVIHAAAGATKDGNQFEYPYTGPLTSQGTILESYRTASFDVTQTGQPESIAGELVRPPYEDVDRYVCSLLEDCHPPAVGGPEPEILPDSLDVASRGTQLLVANDTSGLSVLDASDPKHLALVGRATALGLDDDEDSHATRLVPTRTGAVVLSTSTLTCATCGEMGGRKVAYGASGTIAFVDTRVSSDPVVISRKLAPGDPFGAAFIGERMLVATGTHEAPLYCPVPGKLLPPMPEMSFLRGSRSEDCVLAKPFVPKGALVAYESVLEDAPEVGRITFPASITDVLSVGDIAIASLAEVGLVFVDVSDPSAMQEIARIPFDKTLSNAPGRPNRLRLIGDLLFASAGEGSVVLVDVSNPRQPKLLSGGNSEEAWDAIPVADRLYLAGGDRLTELSLPFSFVTSHSPKRDSVVSPDLQKLVVELNRPIAPTSVNDGSVRLVGPAGNVALSFDVTADPASLRYAIEIEPQEPLVPSAAYELQVDDSVADQRGGSLLVPLRVAFHTGPAGSRSPEVTGVAPAFASTAGGATVVLAGTGLGGLAQVKIGEHPAGFVVRSDSEVEVIVPASVSAGPVHVTATDLSGIAGTLPFGLLYFDDLAAAQVTLSPDHGPAEGGTRVRVVVSARSVVPGAKVMVGGKEGVDVDVVDLSTLELTTPRAQGASLVPITIQLPGMAPVQVGTFSYDIPTSTTIDLPGFPPREASELQLVGETLLVGVPTAVYQGLEIFDVAVEQHPIRLGGLRTDGAVRGLVVSGPIALLAADVFGLVVVDVSQPASPYQIGRVLIAGAATGVRIDGGYAYVSTTDPGLGSGYIQQIDLTDPLLSIVGTVPLDSDALAVDVGLDRFYALTSSVSGGSGSGLHLTIYDRSGARLGDVTVEGTSRAYEQLVKSRLAVRAGRAYVTMGNRVLVFDLSDEAHPRVIQSTALEGTATGMTWDGGALFVATNGSATVTSVPLTELLAVSVSPASGAMAGPNTAIVVEFSLPVAVASVSDTTFQVQSTLGGGPVAGTREVEFAVRGSKVRFTPDAPLLAGDVIHLDVSGLTSIDLRPQASPIYSTFVVAAFDAQQPLVESISPRTALVAAFTPAVIRGSGFRNETTVRVAGSEALVTGSQPDRLDILIPPAPGFSPGPATVEVIDPSGLRTEVVGGVVYREPLRLVSLSPNRSGQQGGVGVTVRGAGFAPGLSVAFGNTNSFDVKVTSASTAVAIAPPGPAGLADVSAHLASQTATLSGAFLYGAGAVARLDAPPLRHVVVEGGAAYVTVGGELDVALVDGSVVRTLEATEGGLLIADLSEPTAVRTISRVTFPGHGGSYRLAKAGSTVYVAAGEAGTRLVDVTLPANPIELGSLASLGKSMDVATSGDVLFVADSSGVKVYRLGETSLPLAVGQRSLTSGATALALHGAYLLATTGEPSGASMVVMDARQGDLPVIGSIPLAGPGRHIAVEGQRAFVSLGRLGQVDIVELADPAAPAPAGTLRVTDPVGGTSVSAEQTLVVADVAYVAAGRGKVQRFAVPVGAPPRKLEPAAVFGDAESLAFLGHYLVVATELLEKNGQLLEVPVQRADDADGRLVGALSSVALDHLEVRGSLPAQGEIAVPSRPIEVFLSDLPDPLTAGAVTVEDGAHQAVPVVRRVAADARGGKVVLEPRAVLGLDADYTIRVGASLADLQGGALGTESVVRFRTAALNSEEQPVIERASPAFGLIGGGNTIEILGSGFLSGCGVAIGGSPATVLGVDASGQRITVVVPPGSAGAASISVVNPSRLQALRHGAYRYLEPPEISAIVPAEAPFSSRTRVRVEGVGLYAGTQVTFGSVPARSVSLLSGGALDVEVPDGVTGVVDVRVATGPVSDSAQAGFAFTLAQLARLDRSAEAMVGVGSAVLVAKNGELAGYDLSIPESPAPVGAVAGVQLAGGLTVVGDRLYLAGHGEVVRYALGGCGSAPGASCSLLEMDRVLVAPPGTALSAVAATKETAYAAVSGGNEVTLLAEVAGRLEVVSQVFMTSGVVRSMSIAGGELAVLIELGASARLEMRSLSDGQLELLGVMSGLPVPATAMASEGSRLAVAVGNGARLVDVSDPLSPATVGSWASAVRPPVGIAMQGPWVLAASDRELTLLDGSNGLARRTWASTYGGPVAFANGVGVVGEYPAARIVEVPYPVVVASSPVAGGTLSAGSPLSVTLGSRMPLATIAGTTIEVLDGAAPITGARSVSGATVRFAPSVLESERAYSARVTLGATDFVGGALGGAWLYPFRAGGLASALSVSAVVPSHGDLAGGYLVKVQGEGFDSTSKVSFGGVEAANAVAPTATELNVVAPAGVVAGPVHLQVTSSVSEVISVPAGFVYVAPLAVSSVVPDVLDLAGGWVSVDGSGFTRGLGVHVGGALVPIRNLTPFHFQAQVPGGPEGFIDLRLSQAGAADLVIPGAVRRADLAPPIVARWEPIDSLGERNVPLGATFVVSFDELIDPSTVGMLKLQRGAVPVPGAASLGPDGRSVVFAPSASLVSTTWYTLLATGLADLAGNAIAAAQRQFRTVDVNAPSVSLQIAGRPMVSGDRLAAEADWEIVAVVTEDSTDGVRTTLEVDGVPVTALSDKRYRYRWPASAVGATSHLLATARDDSGNQSSFDVVVQIVSDEAPHCSFSAPAVASLAVEEGTRL